LFTSRLSGDKHVVNTMVNTTVQSGQHPPVTGRALLSDHRAIYSGHG